MKSYAIIKNQRIQNSYRINFKMITSNFFSQIYSLFFWFGMLKYLTNPVDYRSRKDQSLLITQTRKQLCFPHFGFEIRWIQLIC